MGTRLPNAMRSDLAVLALMRRTIIERDVVTLLQEVARLREEICREGTVQFNEWRPGIHRWSFLPGALNLAQYLALRRRDLRPVQAALMARGLSSLGRSESRVMPTLDAVVATLAGLAGVDPGDYPAPPTTRQFFRGECLLQRHARQLLGPEHPSRRARIMVTLPSDAATDGVLVRKLLAGGMDLVRINCAHDNPGAWLRMIQRVRRASEELRRPCRVLMDLAGPKVRIQELWNASGRRVVPGDQLLLRADSLDPRLPFDIQIRCSLPEVVLALAVGHRVSIDEGRTTCRVERLLPEGVLLRVVHARSGGSRIALEKSINVPDTALKIASLTPKDVQDLGFVTAHADLVGYSFVQDVEDVTALQRELALRGRPRLPVVLKIETARALAHLPELIVATGSVQPVAVMIARGDLAVEIGFERLAEMQEEVLWLSEAASVPAIWATQVLEQFVKKGTPSRAEVSDASMGGRAECVMLNKGAYVAEAIEILDDILARMQEHQSKKTPQLRALRSWA